MITRGQNPTTDDDTSKDLNDNKRCTKGKQRTSHDQEQAEMRDMAHMRETMGVKNKLPLNCSFTNPRTLYILTANVQPNPD